MMMKEISVPSLTVLRPEAAVTVSPFKRAGISEVAASGVVQTWTTGNFQSISLHPAKEATLQIWSEKLTFYFGSEILHHELRHLRFSAAEDSSGSHVYNSGGFGLLADLEAYVSPMDFLHGCGNY